MLSRIIPALKYLITGKMEALEYAVKLHQALCKLNCPPLEQKDVGTLSFNSEATEKILNAFFPFCRVLKESGTLSRYKMKDYLEIQSSLSEIDNFHKQCEKVSA